MNDELAPPLPLPKEGWFVVGPVTGGCALLAPACILDALLGLTREERQRDRRDKGTDGTKCALARRAQGTRDARLCNPAAEPPFFIFKIGVKRTTLPWGRGGDASPHKAHLLRKRRGQSVSDGVSRASLRVFAVKIHWQCCGAAALFSCEAPFSSSKLG